MILVVAVMGDALQRRSCTLGGGRKWSELISAVLPLPSQEKTREKCQHYFFLGFLKALQGAAGVAVQ